LSLKWYGSESPAPFRLENLRKHTWPLWPIRRNMRFWPDSVDWISRVAHTCWLSCMSLCGSVLQLLNRVGGFGGHSVSVGGWVAKLALLCRFAGVSPSRGPEGLSAWRARGRVDAARWLSVPGGCTLSITVFHVAVVLTRRGGRRGRWGVIWTLSAMFLLALLNVRNAGCGIRNPFNVTCCSILYSFILSLLAETRFALQ